MGKLPLLVILINITIAASSCCAGSTDSTKNYVDNLYDQCLDETMNIARYSFANLGYRFLGALMTYNCETSICSPLAAMYALVFTGLYTKNDSAAFQELKELTGLKTKNQMQCVLRLINVFYANRPQGVNYQYGAEVVSSYYDPFSEQFKCNARLTLSGGACNYNSDQLIQARRNINGNIQDQTCGRIYGTIPCSNTLKRNCTANKLVLATGEFLMSLWKRDFDPAGKGNYTANNVTREVDMVVQCDTYNYTNSKALKAQIIQINLKDSFFKYTLFYPNKGTTLGQLIKNLQNKNKYKQAITSLKEKYVKIYQPVFSDVITLFDYVYLFKKVGILTSLYDAGTSSIVDACTGKSNKEYISAGYSKVVYRNTLRGAEPNYCDDSKKMMVLHVSRPGIYTVSRKGIVMFTGSSTVS